MSDATGPESHKTRAKSTKSRTKPTSDDPQVRPAPAAPAREQSLLSAIMNDPGMNGVVDAVQALSPADFFDKRHQVLFRAIRAVVAKGELPVLAAVSDHLRDNGLEGDAGGATYATELTLNVPLEVDLPGAVAAILEKRRLRDIAEKAGQIQDCAMCGDLEAVQALTREIDGEIDFRPTAWFSDAVANTGFVSDCLDRQAPNLDEVFVDSLVAGDVGIIAGAGAVGKSMFSLGLAMSLAAGRPLMGSVLVPCGFGRVLCLFGEESAAKLHYRIRRVVEALCPGDMVAQQAIRDRLTIVPGQGRDICIGVQEKGGDVRPTALFYALERQIRAGGYRLVILDSLSRLFALENENNNSIGARVITRLEQLAAASPGTAVLAVHHVAKNAGRNGGKFYLHDALSQDAIRGASSIPNNARWAGILASLPQKEARQYCHNDATDGQFLAWLVPKKNNGEPDSVHFLKRAGGGALIEWQPKEQKAERLYDFVLPLIKAAVLEAKESGGGLTPVALRKAYAGEWKKINSEVTATAIDGVVEMALNVKRDLFLVPGTAKNNLKTMFISIDPPPDPPADSEGSPVKSPFTSSQENTG